MIPAQAFYLLRHGESEANVLNIAAGGGVNSPLTQAGKHQADKLANFMASLEIKPSRIFHSPQIRAKETAERVNKNLNLSMTEIPLLHEHNLGEWEGKSWEIIRPKIYANETAPGGESRSDFSKRIKTVMDEILAEDHGAPPLIVAHGGTFHAIGKLYEWPFGAMANCHLHFFSPDPSHPPFPWEIWQFDIFGPTLKQTRSEYCPRSRSKVS
jgi:probable phosphoglycerate mutase